MSSRLLNWRLIESQFSRYLRPFREMSFFEKLVYWPSYKKRKKVRRDLIEQQVRELLRG